MDAYLDRKVFVHPKQLEEARLLGRPHFDYPAKSVGQTAHFTVYAATILHQEGRTVAQAVLQKCERDYQTLTGYFGVQLAHCNVIVAPLSHGLDGTGGAYHHTCLAADLYCDVQFNPSLDTDVTNALVIAEETEVFMATQNGGWDCGASNGEGLSRVLAEELYPRVLDGYSTAAAWLDGGRPDWVNRNEATDQDSVANGCSVLFLYWLRYQLNYGWDKICQAAAPTLGQTYARLTGSATDPLPAFKAILEQRFPSGQPSGLTKDNPFPI